MSTYTTPASYGGPAQNELASVEKDRAWHEWMMIGVALASMLSILAIIVSTVALSSTNTTQAAAAPPAASSLPAAAAPVVAPDRVRILVKTDAEHGRRGPDGKWHDAFLPADFTVHAGRTVTITVFNYDNGPHSFTSPAMGVNETIPAGVGLGHPHKMTFTFKAPAQPGQYAWWCAIPCDPWAMGHDGYMRGYVTVVA